MSLTVVSVPIGHPDDITFRAIETIKAAEVLIGEERKPLFQLLKQLDIPRPGHIEYLNEHSEADDIEKLTKLCYSQKVVLVSDCGTPGFCDPGARLVRACRTQGIPVTANPGASSLMVLLSISGLQLKEFLFKGFLPANNEKRKKELQSLKKIRLPIVIMDTPYRLQKTLTELKATFPDRECTLGIRLTHNDEIILQSSLKILDLNKLPKKAEFILIIA